MLRDITNNPEHIFKSRYLDTALIDYSSGEPKKYTYFDLNEKIDQIASGLLTINYPPESRIAIIAANSFEYIVTYFAIRRASFVPVLINYKLSGDQIKKILEHSDSKFIFYDDVFENIIPSSIQSLPFSKLSNIESNIPCFTFDDQERAAFFLYTSGSTGEPKGVVVSTKNRRWTIESQYSLLSNSRTIMSTPMYHMNGLTNIERDLNNQTLIVLLPSFNAEQYIKLIELYETDILSIIPPMMAMILANPLSNYTNFDSVKVIKLGSAPTSKQLYDQIKKRFINANIYLRYGLTEVGPALFGAAPNNLEQPPMSVGYPKKEIEYKLIDDVLYVKSPSMLRTYHKNNTLYFNSLTEDGFFNTKDKFRVDENGFYYFIGRADDMFVSGGENIYPAEVQEIIEKHPDVHQVIVLGLPDEIKGTKPYAFVVKKYGSEVTEEEIQKFVLENAPAYQYPRRVWFIDEMPISGTNKINKIELEMLAKSYL